MKPDVLVAGKLVPHVMAELHRIYAVHEPSDGKSMASLLKEIAPRIRAIATGSHYHVDAALIDTCPKLEIIASLSVGTDAIDVGYARKKGVIVTNTPDVLNDDVANLAVALVLATTRQVAALDRYVRDGRWLKEGLPPLTRSIAGRQIGIVGLGRIGGEIAKKLEVFHPKLAYFARHKKADVSYPYYADLVELARDSAILIVMVPGGKATENLIDRRVIDALGPEGILINVSRGSVVDEPALVAALQEGRLGGAGLDVFADEPNVPAPLLKMDNVVLQPHQGSATVETRRAMGDLMLANLAAHFEGRKLPSPLP
jgi:lactate dehydrogenase-like 2-hydroxyacid dehydrogenase